MTPDQLAKLEASLTPTEERPIEPGWYRFLTTGRMTPEYLKVWRRERDDELMVELVLISNSCFVGTWTGPLDLAAMLEVAREVKRLRAEVKCLLSERDGPGGYGETVRSLREENEQLRDEIAENRHGGGR